MAFLLLSCCRFRHFGQVGAVILEAPAEGRDIDGADVALVVQGHGRGAAGRLTHHQAHRHHPDRSLHGAVARDRPAGHQDVGEAPPLEVVWVVKTENGVV